MAVMKEKGLGSTKVLTKTHKALGSISADKWRQVKNGPHRPRWVLECMFLSFWKAVEFRALFRLKCSLWCPQCVPGLLLICSLFYFIFFAKCSISYSHSSHVSFTCVS